MPQIYENSRERSRCLHAISTLRTYAEERWHIAMDDAITDEDALPYLKEYAKYTVYADAIARRFGLNA